MSRAVPLFGFGGVSGGSDLNFRVVGGLTQPSDPKENTIWVNTDQEVTGYFFSATEPDAPVEGTVWIISGTESLTAFNALKKNGITVCPISAKQYVSGAWVDVTAKIYQGGEWVDWWNGELYKNGNKYETVTGGWTSFKGYSDAMSLGTFEERESSIYMACTSNKDIAYATVNKIDLTDYSEIQIVVTAATTTAASGGGFRVSTTRDTNFRTNQVAVSSDIQTPGVYTIDVSALSGSYYVGAHVFSSSNSYTLEFTEVRLVK